MKSDRKKMLLMITMVMILIVLCTTKSKYIYKACLPKGLPLSFTL
jgi:hypothetical protein